MHHTVIAVINFALLFVSDLSNIKAEQEENVGKREEKKEKNDDVLDEGRKLAELFTKKQFIVGELKKLATNGNEEADRVFRSIEESIK